MDILLPGDWEVEGFDFMRHMWNKFISQFISTTSTETTPARIHLITSFWAQWDTEDLGFIGWIINLNGHAMF